MMPNHPLSDGFKKRFWHHRLAVFSTVLLITLAFFVLSAPVFEWLLGTDMQTTNLFQRFTLPSSTHPLGTDELGRDNLIRLLYGGRVSLVVGLSAALTAAVIGTLIGLIAGYFGGWVDAALMRVTDSVIALPFLPLLIVLAAIDLEKVGLPQSWVESENISLLRIVVIVSFVGWTTVARLVRSRTLALREQTFIKAAEAMGTAPRTIMMRHILPNLSSTVIVATTLSTGNIILLESVLSFLGLGIQPPWPSWGSLLTNAQETIWQSPELAFYPGILIFITVIAFNFLGDGLQDALDPKSVRK